MLASVRETLTSIFKELRIITIAASVTLAIALLVAIFVHPRFTASSSLLVLLSPEYGYRPDAGNDAFVNISLERDAILASEVEILKSPEVELAAMHDVGLSRIDPEEPGSFSSLQHLLTDLGVKLGLLSERDPYQEALDTVSRAFTATPSKTASIIEVSFTNKDRDVAAEMVNAIISNYLKKRQRIYVDSQSDLVAQQAKLAHDQLDGATQAYMDFRASNNISNFEQQMTELISESGELSRQQQATDNVIAEMKTRYDTANLQLESVPGTVQQFADTEADRRVTELRAKLADAQVARSHTAQDFRPDSLEMQSVNRQIDDLTKELERIRSEAIPSAIRNARNPLLDNILLERTRAKAELDAAQARSVELAKHVDAIQVLISDFNSKKAKLDALDLQRQLADRNYEAIVKTLNERQAAEMIEARKSANVRVIQPAEPPLKPSKLRLIILVAGVFLSIVVAVLSAIVCDIVRKGYISPEGLQRGLGVPVLASMNQR